MFDSITFDGWKTLFLTFLPFNFSIFLMDIIAYLGIPALILYLLLKHYREKFNVNPQLGAWRTCGKVWLQIGVILCACIIVLFFLYSYVITFSVSTLKSQEMQYRDYLYEKSEATADVEGKSTKKDASYFIRAIAGKFKNIMAESDEQPAENTDKTSNVSVDAAENTDPFSDDIKKTTKPAKKTVSQTPAVAEGTPAYSVVEFFYLNYRWLHHALYTALLLILTGWFFLLPGYRMMNEKTKINVK